MFLCNEVIQRRLKIHLDPCNDKTCSSVFISYKNEWKTMVVWEVVKKIQSEISNLTARIKKGLQYKARKAQKLNSLKD